MKLLIQNSNILAVDPIDAGDSWQTSDQIIPKHVSNGASLVEVPALPDDYAPGRYTYDGGFVPVLREIDMVTLQAGIVNATQQRLDDFARTRNYDGILSLCTYATSTNTAFSAEGQYGVQARDATWVKLYEILAEVESGVRPIPSGYAEIESELPVLAWPM